MAKSTPEERVQAVAFCVEKQFASDKVYSKEQVLSILTWAVQAARPDGEDHVAPAWLDAVKVRNEVGG